MDKKKIRHIIVWKDKIPRRVILIYALFSIANYFLFFLPDNCNIYMLMGNHTGLYAALGLLSTADCTSKSVLIVLLCLLGFLAFLGTSGFAHACIQAVFRKKYGFFRWMAVVDFVVSLMSAIAISLRWREPAPLEMWFGVLISICFALYLASVNKSIFTLAQSGIN